MFEPPAGAVNSSVIFGDEVVVTASGDVSILADALVTGERVVILYVYGITSYLGCCALHGLKVLELDSFSITNHSRKRLTLVFISC